MDRAAQTGEALAVRRARLRHPRKRPTQLRLLRRLAVEHNEREVEGPELCGEEADVSGSDEEREDAFLGDRCPGSHFF